MISSNGNLSQQTCSTVPSPSGLPHSVGIVRHLAECIAPLNKQLQPTTPLSPLPIPCSGTQRTMSLVPPSRRNLLLPPFLDPLPLLTPCRVDPRLPTCLPPGSGPLTHLSIAEVRGHRVGNYDIGAHVFLHQVRVQGVVGVGCITGRPCGQKREHQSGPEVLEKDHSLVASFPQCGGQPTHQD